MGEKGATLDADAMLTSNQGKFTSQTLRHHTFQCLDKWRHLQNCLVKARSILSLTPLVLISSIRYFAKLSANGCWKTPLQPFQGTMRPNKAPSNVALVSLAEISGISHGFLMCFGWTRSPRLVLPQCLGFYQGFQPQSPGDAPGDGQTVSPSPTCTRPPKRSISPYPGPNRRARFRFPGHLCITAPQKNGTGKH